MAKDNFPFRENSGVSKDDLNRGFTEGMARKEDEESVVKQNYIGGEEPEGLPDGFLGRSKGWER